MSQNSNQESTIRTLGIVSLAVIVFALLYNSLLGGSTGFGYQMSHGHGMGYRYGSGSFMDINGVFASLLVLAVKLLWLVFIGALLAGVVIFIKKYLDENKVDFSFITKVYQAGYYCPSCGIKVSPEFKFCPGCRSSLKETCTGCGRELLPGWKCCTSCGKARENVVEQESQVNQEVQVDQKVQDESEFRSTGTRLSHEDDSI